MRLVAAARARHLQGLVGEYRLGAPIGTARRVTRGCAPLDAVLGVGAGALSPGLSRVACRLGIAEAFAPAAEILVRDAARRRARGSGAPHHRRDRRGGRSGAAGRDGGRRKRRHEPPPADGAPAQLVVAADGVKVHTDGDWHEMKVGVVAPLGPATWTDPDSGRVSQTLGPQSVCAGLEPAATFWWRRVLRSAAAGAGRRARGACRGAGRRGGLDLACGRALSAPGRGGVRRDRGYLPCLGASMDGSQRCLRHGQRGRSRVGRAAETPAGGGRGPPCSRRWPGWSRPAPTATEEVRKARGYFTEQAARMDYPTFIARQLPIGSGVVESANKTLITAREKGAGMRWRGPGAQAVASLRAVHRSGRWDAFWRTQPQRRRPAVFPRPAPPPDRRTDARAAGRLTPQWWGGPPGGDSLPSRRRSWQAKRWSRGARWLLDISRAARDATAGHAPRY